VVQKAFSLIENYLIRKVVNGQNILIGKDPWISCENKHLLLDLLIIELNNQGFFYLNQI
jgi:hypothetical protein